MRCPAMKPARPPAGRSPADVQQARLSLTIADHAELSVAIGVTPHGLLAIGGLVSAILLSTAVLVHTARRPRG